VVQDLHEWERFSGSTALTSTYGVEVSGFEPPTSTLRTWKGAKLGPAETWVWAGQAPFWGDRDEPLMTPFDPRLWYFCGASERRLAERSRPLSHVPGRADMGTVHDPRRATGHG
jgi:hypothetical protein